MSDRDGNGARRAAAKIRQDFYLEATARAARWRQIALGLLALAILSVVGLSAVSLQQEIHVVTIDSRGEARLAETSEAKLSDEMVIRTQVREWISMARSVTSDAGLQELWMKQVLARSEGVARERVIELHRLRNPFEVAAKATIAVEEVSILPLERGDRFVWEISWLEVWRSRMRGESKERSRWRAFLNYRVVPPAVSTVNLNPLGFIATEVDWVQIEEVEE